ncbi:phage holin family protein [Spirillospora sp. CA-108201]
MPARNWLSRIDEASGVVLIGFAGVAGVAALLGLLACVVLVFAGVAHALFPYWPYVLTAFLVLVVLPLTVSGVRASFKPESRISSGRTDLGWGSSSMAGPIDWHTQTSYSCRRCRHNWTSHGNGQGSCAVEGPPYTTETSTGWEGDIIQTESGTPCGCPGYEGIEPP